MRSDGVAFIVSAVHCGRGDDRLCSDAGGCKYKVAWAINPHMRIGAGDFARAHGQHEALKATLAGLGADITELPFVHGAFDSVFAKDTALVVEGRGFRRALLANQRFRERRAEQIARARSYEVLGYDVVHPPAVHWEGGDVALLPSRECALLGYGPRSDRRAHVWLEKQIDTSVVPLELCDPHLFHLDMALGVLPDGTVLICEQAFTKDSLERLLVAPGIREVLAVPRDDALRFALNFVPIGDAIVCGAQVPSVERIIRERGFRSVPVPLDEFHNAGGSAACLVARVHRDRRERKTTGPPSTITGLKPFYGGMQSRG